MRTEAKLLGLAKVLCNAVKHRRIVLVLIASILIFMDLYSENTTITPIVTAVLPLLL